MKTERDIQKEREGDKEEEGRGKEGRGEREYTFQGGYWNSLSYT